MRLYSTQIQRPKKKQKQNPARKENFFGGENIKSCMTLFEGPKNKRKQRVCRGVGGGGYPLITKREF